MTILFFKGQNSVSLRFIKCTRNLSRLATQTRANARVNNNNKQRKDMLLAKMFYAFLVDDTFFFVKMFR